MNHHKAITLAVPHLPFYPARGGSEPPGLGTAWAVFSQRLVRLWGLPGQLLRGSAMRWAAVTLTEQQGARDAAANAFFKVYA